MLLFFGQLRPGTGLPLKQLAQVIVLEQHARLDGGQGPAGLVRGEVGEDAVVALPVEGPGAVN
ncbi:hypothetical protein [Streptomyces sp. NPDC059262]|uniref:hypothetical protein n=1 Tax=Streptomyces sp. NPDC059262 TaxID=3346797 RepID=UPI00367433B6